MKRVFIIVLDSFGIGAMPDSGKYGDIGVNTLASVAGSPLFKAENLKKLGLFNIDGVEAGEKCNSPAAAYCRLRELSAGKDTTIGHWEIAGIVSRRPLPTYPDGFPDELLEEFSKRTGRKILCNKPYSGTEVIKDYGDEHIKTGALIVYTSADSVFQIAAHEDIVPLDELYRYCRIARDMLVGEHGVGRVIARPFITENGVYKRTSNRHDFSLPPPLKNGQLYILHEGKIYDIFVGNGITEHVFTSGNADGMAKTAVFADKDFNGVCFTNLVDFDMLYGHRNNIDGYAGAITEFDKWLGEFIPKLKEDDILIITADHGCDPGYTVSTDHSREYVPLIIYGKNISPVNCGTKDGFCVIGKTVCDYLGAKGEIDGESMLSEIMQ